MKSFTEEGMRLANRYAHGEWEGPATQEAFEALRSHLRAMEDENKRLRNSYLELRGIFRANMLRAFAGKDVDAEIDKALEIPDRVIFSATPQEGSEAP